MLENMINSIWIDKIKKMITTQDRIKINRSIAYHIATTARLNPDGSTTAMYGFIIMKLPR